MYNYTDTCGKVFSINVYPGNALYLNHEYINNRYCKQNHKNSFDDFRLLSKAPFLFEIS